MPDKRTKSNAPCEILALLSNELLSVGIPSRPVVLASIEKEMLSSAPCYGTLEKIISIDVGLSASLLKIANSAFFGCSGHVRSVNEALQILGLNTVSTAVAALSLRKAFGNIRNMERFWDSSARIAQLSGWLATQLTFPDQRIKPEEAFTFGLFRDCGIPILMGHYSNYIAILSAANAEAHRAFTAVEDDEIAVDHAMIGAMLAKKWQLPVDFQAAIAGHHDSDVIRGLSSHAIPDIARYFISISQLAEHIFQRLSGMNKTQEWIKLGDLCLDILGIKEPDTDLLMEAAVEKALHIELIL